jgi:hypothetical protein
MPIKADKSNPKNPFFPPDPKINLVLSGGRALPKPEKVRSIGSAIPMTNGHQLVIMTLNNNNKEL